MISIVFNRIKAELNSSQADETKEMLAGFWQILKTLLEINMGRPKQLSGVYHPASPSLSMWFHQSTDFAEINFQAVSCQW